MTLFGESGGGAKISTLLAMPAARGLFHRAAIQSGPGLSASTVEQATRSARRLLDSLSVTPRELWSVPAAALVEGGGMGMGSGPAVDGAVLPSSPAEALAAGSAADVPVIVGCNADEGAGGLPADLDEAVGRGARAVAAAAGAGGTGTRLRPSRLSRGSRGGCEPVLGTVWDIGAQGGRECRYGEW